MYLITNYRSYYFHSFYSTSNWILRNTAGASFEITKSTKGTFDHWRNTTYGQLKLRNPTFVILNVAVWRSELRILLSTLSPTIIFFGKSDYTCHSWQSFNFLIVVFRINAALRSVESSQKITRVLAVQRPNLTLTFYHVSLEWNFALRISQITVSLAQLSRGISVLK